MPELLPDILFSYERLHYHFFYLHIFNSAVGQLKNELLITIYSVIICACHILL